jgi:hypothetical protein
LIGPGGFEVTMSTGDASRKTRGLTLSAFLLHGIAAAGFVMMLVFDDRRATPLDGFVLWSLALGFFSALGPIVSASPEPPLAAVRVTRLRERRDIDRRLVDRGSPTGIERRSGRDRRTVLTLGDRAD